MFKKLVFGACLLAFSSLSAAPAPNFTLKKLDGSLFTLADHVGKQPIVINFWASCCPTSHKNVKIMQEIKKKHKDVLVVGVSIDGPKSASQMSSWVKMRGLSYDIVVDPDLNVCKLFNPGGTAPYTVIIDKKGEITYSQSDYMAGYEKGFLAAVETVRK